MSSVIPLVSSGTAGPLKAIHLPRLWLKHTLAAAGKLPDDYDESGNGFDAMTLAALNLKRDDVISFVRSQKPTYMQFEEWVVHQNGGKIDSAKIEAHNAAIRGYDHTDADASAMRAASGVRDASVKDAVTLNTLNDLDELYHQISSTVPA